jgi:hypothetical protein
MNHRVPQIRPGGIRVKAQIGAMSGACDYVADDLAPPDRTRC